MEKIFLILLAVSCVYCQDSTPVQQCGQEKLFKNVAIYTSTGLCKTLPCKMKIGEDITAVIQFQNKDPVQMIISKCTANIFGTDVDFSIPNAENGCDQLVNMKCPIKANSDVTIKVVVPVKEPEFEIRDNKLGPSIVAKLQFFLLDQAGKMISCFRMTSKVELP